MFFWNSFVFYSIYTAAQKVEEIWARDLNTELWEDFWLDEAHLCNCWWSILSMWGQLCASLGSVGCSLQLVEPWEGNVQCIDQDIISQSKGSMKSYFQSGSNVSNMLRFPYIFPKKKRFIKIWDFPQYL